MFDPDSGSFIFALLGIMMLWCVSLALVGRAFTHWVPGRKLHMIEQRAAAGDPDAMRSMRFLDELDAAFKAGTAQDEQRRSALLSTGRRALAELRAVNVGSTRVERGTVMRPVTMTLAIPDDGRELTVTEYVNELYVARLLVGAEVPVFVDRLNPDILTVGWDVA